MMYIKFDIPKNNIQDIKDGFIKKMVKKALLAILPMANPDFDDKIDDVIYWLVECDDETGFPEREIGLDKEWQVILKMPFGNNYGYWTDNNLLVKDFKEYFSVSEISKKDFEHNWDSFNKNEIKNEIK